MIVSPGFILPEKLAKLKNGKVIEFWSANSTSGTPTVSISFWGGRCCRALPFQNTRGAFWGLFWDVVGFSPTHGYLRSVPVQFWVSCVKGYIRAGLELSDSERSVSSVLTRVKRIPFWHLMTGSRPQF
jgi:hypothetical protein